MSESPQSELLLLKHPIKWCSWRHTILNEFVDFQFQLPANVGKNSVNSSYYFSILKCGDTSQCAMTNSITYN